MRELKRKLWPYRVEINPGNAIEEIETWLGERVGCFKQEWNVVYLHNHDHYYFKNSNDATMFALKWTQ